MDKFSKIANTEGNVDIAVNLVAMIHGQFVPIKVYVDLLNLSIFTPQCHYLALLQDIIVYVFVVSDVKRIPFDLNMH